MNKLPAKQIYLLLIIIIGIIALSVYSTYSIFTLEGETSDVVNFKTLNSLDVSEEMYEYKQVTIPKNSYVKTDVDIYNSYNKEICYSIWYKISTKNSNSKVSVYQYTDEGLTASGVLNNLESRRITLVLTNDYDYEVKVNFGVSSSIKEDTCKLDVSTDKTLVSSTISSISKLSDYLKKEETTESEEEYLLYKDYNKEITLNNNITISNKYTLENEKFTLEDSEEIDLTNYNFDKDKEYYTCLNNTSCQTLYKINSIEYNIDKYILTKYDKLFSYSKGISGIRKINNNYIYYGDNPHNFVYYDCQTSDSSSCKLFRIIGLFYDETNDKYITKIISNESISSYKFNTTNNKWLNSSVDKYLNEEYKINNPFSYKMLEKQEYIKDNKILFETKNNDSIIRIMTLTDYLNASTCTKIELNSYEEKCLKENYLNIYNKEWTSTYNYLEETRTEEITNEENTEEEPTTKTTTEVITNRVFTIGSSIKDEEVTNEYNIRPVIYLSDRVFLSSGDGTINNPYIIK